MDIVYKAGRASATDVLDGMEDPPSYSAVRAMMRILEQKGHLKHEIDGTRYVYVPTLAKQSARKSVLRNVIDTFFEGSTEKVVAALLDLSRDDLSQQELERLSALIDQAREEGR
jgi:predicted transcriptional regulator